MLCKILTLWADMPSALACIRTDIWTLQMATLLSGLQIKWCFISCSVPVFCHLNTHKTMVLQERKLHTVKFCLIMHCMQMTKTVQTKYSALLTMKLSWPVLAKRHTNTHACSTNHLTTQCKNVSLLCTTTYLCKN